MVHTGVFVLQVVNSARVAKQAGCQNFLLVSSAGTNKNSPFLYPKTKGITEEDVKAIGFKKLSIFRPAMLLCDRSETRAVEHLTKIILSPIAYVCPTFITIPVPKVAQALVKNAVLSQKPYQLLENAEIHHLADQPWP